jgi:hypothetical protein
LGLLRLQQKFRPRGEILHKVPIELSEKWITFCIVLFLISVSTVLMLRSSSAELSWDEAVYAQNVGKPWKDLWSRSDYQRNGHGPMAIYLSKLGNDDLPAVVRPVEERLRFPIALVSSLAIGLVYWALRHTFRTSRSAAIVGSSLLLLSVIRLQETPIISPHHLTLLFTLAVAALGYRWRNADRLGPAILLGGILGVAAVTMTYVIPLALCWGLSVLVAGGAWMQCDSRQFKISWLTFAAIGVAGVVALLLWPPLLLHIELLRDFIYYARFPNSTTLVGSVVFEHTPRLASLYWIATLDSPILICALVTFGACFRGRLRERHITSKHVYLGTFLIFFLVTALKAHLASARSLALLIGILCLTIGAVFDEPFTKRPQLMKWAAAVIVLFAAVNLTWLSWNPNRIPYLNTNGYRAFVEGNAKRLSETETVIIFGEPILKFYAEQAHIPINWKLSRMPWTPRHDVDLPAQAKYALIPELAYRYLPADQPVQRDIVAKWRLVWSFKENRSYGLRLYERP